MKQVRFFVFLITALSALSSIHGAPFRISQIAGYNTGNLGADAMTGQQDQWFLVGNPGTITVTNGSGSLNGTALGLVASAGDRVFIGANNNINTSRNQFAPASTFPPGVETNIYYSFLYKFNNASDVGDADPSGEAIIRVNRANSGTGTAQHWDLLARNVSGQIQLGISKAGSPNNLTNWASTNINVGETILVVVRQRIVPGSQNDIYDLWINPPAQSFGATEVDVPAPSASIGANLEDGAEDQSGTGPGRFVLGSGLNAEFDEFRVANTWEDATPRAGQCANAAVEADPASVTQSAELSATFKVAPLGTSPTIQWQVSTNAGGLWRDIPEATTASYTTGPLSLSESGSQYRAVISVACNNTFATSTVATVTLTAPAETPAGLVLHDTFIDPDLGFDDRSNPPITSSNSVWYTANTDTLTAFEQVGNMVGTPLAGSSSLWLGYFTETNASPIHLAVGRALKVTLPFVANSFSSFTNNGSLRIGLFDYFDGAVRIEADGPAAGGSRGNGRGVRGYMLNLDFGPTFSNNSPLQLLARSFLEDDNLMGSIGSYESFGSGPAGGGFSGAPAFTAGTEYRLEFVVSRTAVDSVDVTATITGGGTNWSHTINDTNYVYRRFDSIAIRPNSLETSADSFAFPEFRVEVIDSAVPISPFNITAIAAVPPNGFRLTWDSRAGGTYHVLATPSLAPVSWTTNATVTATGPQTTHTDSPLSDRQRFYRVLAAP